MIYARSDAVSEIMKSMGCNKVSEVNSDEENPDIKMVQPEIHHTVSSVLTTLGRAPDVQRGITRIFYRTATPSEVTYNLTLHFLMLNPVVIYVVFHASAVAC